MRRIGLVVMTLTIVLAGVAVVHVGTTGEQRVFAQTVMTEAPLIGVRGEEPVWDEDGDIAHAERMHPAEPKFTTVNGVEYFDLVSFSVDNAYPGLEMRFTVHIYNQGADSVDLGRKEFSWPDGSPCMELTWWQLQVGGETREGATFADLEAALLSEPIPSEETLTLELLRRVSASSPQGATCREMYVLGIPATTDPPDPGPPSPGPAAFGGGGFAADPPCFFDVDMLGEVTRVYVTCADSRCVQDYEPEDPSGRQFLDLKQGTQVTHEREESFRASPPRWVRMRVAEDVPPVPEGMVALGDVYDFTGFTANGEPVDSVYFDRQVGMELAYHPDDLPDDAIGIGIGYWDPEAGRWQLLPQSVGRIAAIGIATADVTQFSTFAVLATVPVEEPPAREVVWQPPEEPAVASFTAQGLVVQPDTGHLWGPIRVLTHSARSATVMVTVTNTGDAAGTFTAELLLDGAGAGLQEVNLDKGERTVLSFELRDLEDGVHRVQIAGLTAAFTTYQQVNWWLIIIAAAALILIVAVIVRVRGRSRVHEGHTD